MSAVSQDDLKKIAKDWLSPNTYNCNFETPPDKPGVYMIIITNLDYMADVNVNQKKVIYVGSSKNLNKRYVGHEVVKIARALLPQYHVGFYFKLDDDYKNTEKYLIKKYKPLINLQHNV